MAGKRSGFQPHDFGNGGGLSRRTKVVSKPSGIAISMGKCAGAFFLDAYS